MRDWFGVFVITLIILAMSIICLVLQVENVQVASSNVIISGLCSYLAWCNWKSQCEINAMIEDLSKEIKDV